MVGTKGAWWGHISASRGSLLPLDRLQVEHAAQMRLPSRRVGLGIIHHPQSGLVLWDSGIHPRLRDSTSRWPFWLYRFLVPFTLAPEETALAQLQSRGHKAGDVKAVILTHLHSDHVAGVLDFPEAEIICPRKDWEDCKGSRGFKALRKAFFPDLFPASLDPRLRLIDGHDSVPDFLTPFSHGTDLFGDGSCWMVAMPGHSPGHMGVYLKTTDGPVLMAADACWRSRSYLENADVPGVVHRILTPAPSDFRRTLERLHLFHRRNPEVKILLSHCPDC